MSRERSRRRTRSSSRRKVAAYRTSSSPAITTARSSPLGTRSCAAADPPPSSCPSVYSAAARSFGSGAFSRPANRSTGCCAGGWTVCEGPFGWAAGCSGRKSRRPSNFESAQPRTFQYC